MKRNLIIRASAGTGKTFALATRFISLLLFQNVSPDRILALTFSRAAAQEIYMKLLERLWKAAASDGGAAAEKAILCARLTPAERAALEAGGVDWSRARFAEILRRVIAVQHHGTIATLDSFILRIVRSFPLEMGFQNAVDVLDGFAAERAVADSCAALLNREDEARDVIAAYRTATGCEFVRTCSRELGKVLAGWRDFAFANRAWIRGWTSATMRAALGVAENPQPPDLSAIARSGKRNDPCAAFADQVAGFTPDEPVFGKNKAGEMARFLFTHPEATAYEYLTPAGKAVRVACGGAAGAAAVRAGVKYMLDLKLGRQLDVVAAKLALCRMIESEYDANTRRQGKLTFADFTDCQAVAEDSEEALRLERLQFRMDSRFDHWALDEFQDTSALQWKCLKRLVREAAQAGGGRTVMTVGDLKQSIYTWRGGDDAPFKEMMENWPEFRGEEGEIVANAVSYRYEKNTADFINRVFGPGNIRDGGLLGETCRDAIDRWLAATCWMEHEPDRKNGEPKSGDFVEVIAVAKPEEDPGEGAGPADDQDAGIEGTAAVKILAPRICDLAADLWRQHEEAKSTETLGILVRGNRDGAALAEALRARGLPVVWEGRENVIDVPAVRAVLELLWLAEHPQDSFAWKTVNDLLPVRRAVFPELTHQEKVSQEMAGMLSRLGLARALREVVSRICAAPERPDARSVIRLEELVREAVGYERRASATAGVGVFIDYLAATSGREISDSPHVIRILTIHRSKGLTFDHVIVPIAETGLYDTIVKPRRGTPLFGEGWAVSSLAENEAMLNVKTAAAWTAAANERVLEQLRLNYVALTRARKSTHVFLCDDPHGDRIQFRDLLQNPFRGETPARQSPYGRLVCDLGTMPPFGRRMADETDGNAPWKHGTGGTRVAHRSPSAAEASYGRGWRTSAAVFFGGEPSAAERGTAAHADFAAIGWIDPSAPKSEFESWILSAGWNAAFVRPAGPSALWRERSYEIFESGCWQTGQFDRVVFTGEGASRRAAIYDFKTNTPQPGEKPVAFAERMKETYQGQMAAYRTALVRLTGLPLSAVSTALLLTRTGAMVAMA